MSLVGALGCGGADDAPEDGAVGSQQSAEDIVSVEQAITLPLEEPGPAQQCAVACYRFDVTGSALGQCCVCNGNLKRFMRSPWNANLFLCQ
jgi:hypothetical protein